jgi:hypothetical protein
MPEGKRAAATRSKISRASIQFQRFAANRPKQLAKLAALCRVKR